MDDIYLKKQKLNELISGYGKVMVAFSGGTDSAFLLKTAHDVLGRDAVAITNVSPAVFSKELLEAKEFCKKHGIEHILMNSDELSEVKGFSENPEDRCYLCKKAMLKKALDEAKKLGILTILEGSNKDDDNEKRPGFKAVKELGIKSPLREAGLTKDEIRKLSKEAGLETWNKPSATCLYTRFAHGETITHDKLKMIEAAEKELIDLGFEKVRVRLHKDVARIEIEKTGFKRLAEPKLAGQIDKRFKELGFRYVAMDLAGYVSGSMDNERKQSKDHIV